MPLSLWVIEAVEGKCRNPVIETEGDLTMRTDATAMRIFALVKTLPEEDAHKVLRLAES